MKRLGITPFRHVRPVANLLRQRAGAAFELVEDFPSQLALKLREHRLDGALLSPIDFAREYQMYRLVPRVAIVSRGASNESLLFFHEGSRKISTIAVDPRFTSEVVLAHLVLVEKFETHPKIVPTIGTLTEMLQKADAALVTGDQLPEAHDQINRLDLVEEWEDITDLPFVHGVWVTREGVLTEPELRLISNAVPVDGSEESANQSPHFRYNFDDEAVDGMIEFFRIAYYHGVLRDIPEVRFLSLA